MASKNKKKTESTDDTATGGVGRQPEPYKDLIAPETLTSMMKEAIKKDVKNGIFTEKQGNIMLQELAKAQTAIKNQNKNKTK